MVTSVSKPSSFDEIRPGVKRPAKETLLTPRFYTTDFEEMAKMDLSVNEDEVAAIIEEMRIDYNRNHFVRDEKFDRSWDDIPAETRQIFIEFLESSCTSEFSGFLLYKELSRKLKHKNPLLAEGFNLLSRDEARHAGFLNKAMSDFGLSLDLGFLTQNHNYTFFKPKFIFYSVYLSEKIGYWRYIKIFQHLEANPEHRIYPIFHFFDNWCQDENRHGDFFDAVMRGQPQLLNDTRAKLWCRFFLLAVFATMYLRDRESKFYGILGMNSRDFDIEVIQETNKTAGRVFPIILDVDNSKFFPLLDECAADYLKLVASAQSSTPKFLKKIMNLPTIASMGVKLLRLYLLKPIDMTAQAGVVR
ncbi:magnesium-protoporphyrin IX monomethyl ester (oxidative) cyclase [Chamaesiphon sp. VAR_48_metabat_135_sub]|uniref:magnesium-protoporphyrin IX monomethyl ester (oxidative) cyclase n=1 Tax=Chamaesiphon sp. VAR_48_metabat_135_sub TaxID=2964699 RepID=UPI00286A3300|nr:magnesium-protoporphyrin IX monomethyl ester (oxidative) cyclase [Chamaesiphon sp. VAR_48_metabat_135_sub]